MQNKDAAIQERLLDDEQPVPVAQIYKIKTVDLQQIFQQSGQDRSINYRQLDQHGKTKGIIKKLASEPNTGIVGDEKDLRRRKKVFGENLRPTPPNARFVESIMQTLQNVMWVAIGVTALLSSVVSLFFINLKDCWEGLSVILVAILLVAIVAATDYLKDKKFIQLSMDIKEEKVPVIRGKLGATQSISVWDIVVGDVVILQTGASVPADCLLIEAQDLVVDEPIYSKQENGMQEETRDVIKNLVEPCLLAGSIIKRGQCKAVVCCVGVNSSRGVKENKLDTEKDTALQTKLQNLEKQFIKYAFLACILVLILIIIMLVVKITGDTPWYEVLFQQSFQYANMLVVLFVVIVPEGLPLTIGVSLAYTTGRMYSEDRILVKQLDAPEKMGEVTEILVGKTNTITSGDMKVGEFLCEDKPIKNTRKNTLLHCELSRTTIELIKESIMFNCSARIEMDATRYIPVGNPTECGLLRFLQLADIPVHLLIQQKLSVIKTTSPFSSFKKRSATVLSNPNRPGKVTAYLKGAPEVIIEMCQSIQSHEGIKTLSQELKMDLNKAVDQMASKPLRVISYAFFEMDEDQWNVKFEESGIDFEQALDEGSIPFTLIGTFGLKDPLRPNVKSVVNAVKQKGFVNVRMISGDHYETAKKVAKKAGILSESDLQNKNCVMDAEQFRDEVGRLEYSKDVQNDEDVYTVQREENFKELIKEVKVLTRANPDDKLLMVIGLKNCDKTVAVTGDGINDIDALEHADVGLAMGSGCSAAKQVSSLILANDDFESSIRAVMWGRNIYHNVGRFLQFQLTVNISTIFLVILGILFFGESPLSAVHLLWINLIMDTFAAIALSTEPPLEKILSSKPTKQILTAAIWRQVLGLALWNILIILFLFMFGGYVGGLEEFSNYGDRLNTEDPGDCAYESFDQLQKMKLDSAKATKCKSYWGAQSKNKLFTYIFCVLVFSHGFNYFNCRKIGQSEKNVFERIITKKGVNIYFWISIAFVFGFQFFMVQYLFVFTKTTPLSRSEWGACIIAGSTVIPVAFCLKYTGKGVLKMIPFTKFIDEDKQVEDGLVNKVTDLSSKKVEINTSGFGRKKSDGYNEFDGDQDDHYQRDNNA